MQINTLFELRLKSSKEGFTLIELTIATAILAIVLLALVSATLQAFLLLEDSDERVVAVNEAQIVLNQLRIANTDDDLFPGNVVGDFPAGDLDDADRDALNGETITIAYEDETTNPLNVTIIVGYIGSNGRNKTEILNTYLSNF